jgi:hypothetical protein
MEARAVATLAPPHIKGGFPKAAPHITNSAEACSGWAGKHVGAYATVAL